MNYTIEHLPKEKWSSYKLPVGNLYDESLGSQYAWGVIENNEIIAAIETAPYGNDALLIDKVWIKDETLTADILKELIDITKEQLRLEHRKRVSVACELLGCADAFLNSGFKETVKNDISEITYIRPTKKIGELIIRKETPNDFRAVEIMTQRAFWNRHQMGCDEHLLVKNLRTSSVYIPELSRIAVADGKIAGAIFYSVAKLVNDKGERKVLTFGPLCIDPEYQNCGIGGKLLRETMTLARTTNYPGIVIFGEPAYYPRHGFLTCDKFDITAPNGENYSSLMGYEFSYGSLKDIKGKFFEAKVFEDLPKDEVDKLSAEFPPLVKRKFPCQW